MILSAKVLDPSVCRRSMTCEGCGISYSNKHYQLFFDEMKIVYFSLNEKHRKKITICNSCLLSLASMTCLKYDLSSVNIIINNGGKIETIKIDVSNHVNEEEKLSDILNKVH